MSSHFREPQHQFPTKHQLAAAKKLHSPPSATLNAIPANRQIGCYVKHAKQVLQWNDAHPVRSCNTSLAQDGIWTGQKITSRHLQPPINDKKYILGHSKRTVTCNDNSKGKQPQVRFLLFFVPLLELSGSRLFDEQKSRLRDYGKQIARRS